ncbi:MAG: endonuclease domain-containing protein [Oscillospiraceae bacterium]|nr:endonuclease domain-containing protein [Oscillospiraceae bacterium]
MRDGQNVQRIRDLRNNATPQENKLWYQYLRAIPLHFRRQFPIGDYIVDFYCARLKLAIELDGRWHFEPAQAEYDAIRTEYINARRITVLRFANTEVDERFDSVCEVIHDSINNLQMNMSPPRNMPPPPPTGGTSPAEQGR